MGIRTGRAWPFVSVLALPLALVTISPAMASIHPGDSLYIKVWNHPELSKQVIVDADGGIRVPLSGVVNVGGLDELAAGKRLADALRGSVAYPAVSVETVEQGKNIFVSGGTSGVLSYKAGETLSAAIAEVMQTPDLTQSLNSSGQSLTKSDSPSVTTRARVDLRNVKIQRDGKILGQYDTVAFGITGDTGPLLQPSDTIILANKPVEVRVLGDVGHHGLAYLSPDQSVSEAISQAGGLLPTAASNHILLARDGKTQSLALGDQTFNAPAKSGDVITVPAAPRINVVGTVVTPGVVALKTDSTLLSAIYTAGGPTKQSNLKDVQVIHGTTKTAYNVTALTRGDMSQNPVLADGDTVLVPQGNYFDFTSFFGILGGIAAGLATRL